eukprot:s239_g25.t1
MVMRRFTVDVPFEASAQSLREKQQRCTRSIFSIAAMICEAASMFGNNLFSTLPTLKGHVASVEDPPKWKSVSLS